MNEKKDEALRAEWEVTYRERSDSGMRSSSMNFKREAVVEVRPSLKHDLN